MPDMKFPSGQMDEDKIRAEKINKGKSFAELRLKLEANVFDQDFEKLKALVQDLIYILGDLTQGEIVADTERVSSAASHFKAMSKAAQSNLTLAINTLSGGVSTLTLEDLTSLYQMTKKYHGNHDKAAKEECEEKSHDVREKLERLFEGIEMKG